MATIQKLREKQERLTKSINSETRNLEIATKDRMNAENELVKTTKLLDDAKDELKIFKDKIDKSKSEVGEATEAITGKDALVAEYNEAIRARKDKIDLLEKKHDALMVEFSEKNTNLNDEFKKKEEDWDKKIIELEKEQNGLLVGNKVIAEGNGTLEKQRDEITKKIGDLKNGLKIAKDEFDRQKTQTEIKKKDYTDIIEKIKKETEEFGEKNNEIAELNKEIEKIGKDKIKVEEEYKKSELKLFKIGEREEHVKEYELMIKDACKRAGIKYEEFIQS